MPQACAVAWLAVSGAAVHVGLRRTATGALGWDGQHWRWEPTAGHPRFPEGELSVSLDLQSLVLVAFRSVGRPVVWLWLDRGAAPASWHLLRCALYGRPMAERGPSPSAVAAP